MRGGGGKGGGLKGEGGGKGVRGREERRGGDDAVGAGGCTQNWDVSLWWGASSLEDGIWRGGG